MIDHQTLIDLNIIPSSVAALSLKAKLDHCQTRGGKEYLERLLKLQAVTYPEILDRQQWIRFICGQLGKWRLPVQEDDLFYLKQYLGTGYTLLPTKNRIRRTAISIKRFLFNKAQYYFTLSGIKGTLRVVQEIVLLCRAVYDPLMPRSLKEQLEAVQEAIASLGIGERTFTVFLHEEPAPTEVFRVDNLLRAQHAATITRILSIYYQLEAYYSLATAHTRMQLSFPELQEDGREVRLEGLWHPLVPHCNSNTIHMAAQHMMIITGPNMSGKSTFMKSVGVAFVMAYLGMGVAATAAVIPVMDVIVTCIDIKDDMEKGYSYFFSEVQRVRTIAEKIRSGKRVIVIGDELFKGTNVQDAVDCTVMVLEGFLKHPRNFYFIATHFTTIAEQFQTVPACYPVCFDGRITATGISFDFRLQPGISTLHIGSLILQQQQVPALLDPAVVPVV